eukprot:gnl/MRDRNA2_/MRDRNA2_97619_c0_seq1.p1 gnl/MRDRNA2_/MRDRNA2_97619_c0~~gnl/MRDRNA2_/MRDRNA2_97619_c0_seq1.p1  ORF type:complete len:718 (+),score=165.77 gnl/MRDRNA2_/MRDRNA2_97619_c0_seq1:111-2264(+)
MAKLPVILLLPWVTDASLQKYAQHLRCPFAPLWLEHGPEKAAKMLNMDLNGHAGRNLGAHEAPWGSCTYTNAFAGGEMCFEFRGSTWDQAAATERCNNAMPGTAGTLAKDTPCPKSDNFAGWCMTNEGKEAGTMDRGGMMDTCEKVSDGCAQWSQGEFKKDGVCAADASAAPASGPPAGSGGTDGVGMNDICGLAPGPVGAAHMGGYSPGYKVDCAGAPAEQSPWMWPLKWSAHVHSRTYKFGSDVPQYEGKSQVWYMLNKNWKRMDSYESNGTLRAIGQAPCENNTMVEDDGMTCNRGAHVNMTVLHRQNKMYFIEYSDDFKTITKCSWMDLMMIGNIRPDWFMDDRGDSTDVQYIGNEHVYHRGVPRLVKKWRKMDFANQYFTMSMQAIPGEDKVHWPLILNVPGEGFGDDQLQDYTHHKLLTDADEALFLIDEAYVANGGACPKIESDMSGPPTHLEHVPSNLEREKVSWRKVLWTGSPVWTPPVAGSAMADVQQVGKGVGVQSCWDEAASMLRLEATFETEEEAWTAISWREEEACLMTPRDGSDGEVLYAVPNSAGSWEVMFGPLKKSLKTFDKASLGAFVGDLKSVSDVSEFSDVSASFADGKVTLAFKRKYSKKPDNFYLNYAHGKGKKFEYHKSRGCFTAELVSCDAMKKSGDSDECPACPTCRFDLSGVKGPEEESEPTAASFSPSMVGRTSPWVLLCSLLLPMYSLW